MFTSWHHNPYVTAEGEAEGDGDNELQVEKRQLEASSIEYQ